MKTLRWLSVFALCLLIFSSCAKESSMSPAEVFSDLSQKARNVDSYRVETRTSTHVGGQQVTVTGTVAYKKPGLIHTTSTTNMMGGMTHEMFRSENVIWTYMPHAKIATKMELPEMPAEMAGQQYPDMDPLGMLANFPEEALSLIGKKVVDGNEVFELQISPEHFRKGIPSSHADMPRVPQKMEYLIYTDNGLPYKMLMYGKDGSVIMEQSYTNYEVNIPIPDSEFQFTPPEGVQIMDMAQAAGNMMDEMKKKGGTHPPMGRE